MPITPEILATIQNSDGSTANFPQTAGGAPIFQPNVVPAGYYFYGSGAFDDIATGTRGEGDQITLKTDGTADDQVELVGRFMEHVYILGGHLANCDADYDDWISLLVRSPASAPTDKTATHDGNANKVSVGPFNIIVPAANDGDWDVDGTTLEAGEINQSLSPVPAFNSAGDPNGWWDWDPTATPSITPNLTNTGAFNLFDAAIPLGRQANRYPAITQGNVTPAGSIKAKKMLPHWEWVFTLRRGSTAGTVKVAIRLDTARLTTV